MSYNLLSPILSSSSYSSVDQPCIESSNNKTSVLLWRKLAASCVVLSVLLLHVLIFRRRYKLALLCLIPVGLSIRFKASSTVQDPDGHLHPIPNLGRLTSSVLVTFSELLFTFAAVQRRWYLCTLAFFLIVLSLWSNHDG